WLEPFTKGRELTIPATEFDTFLAAAFAKREPPPLRLPAETGIATHDGLMRPRLTVRKSSDTYRADILCADLTFRYGEVHVAATDTRSTSFDPAKRVLVRRDRAAEEAAVARLAALGLKPPSYYDKYHTVTSKRLPEVVRVLIGEGWRVEAEGKLYRS